MTVADYVRGWSRRPAETRAFDNVGVGFYSPAPVAAAVTDLAALVMSRLTGDG
jgi:hypothetical protein